MKYRDGKFCVCVKIIPVTIVFLTNNFHADFMKLFLLSVFISFITSGTPPASLQGTYGIPVKNEKAPYSVLQIH